MSKIRHKRFITGKALPIIIMLTLISVGIVALQGCSWSRQEDMEKNLSEVTDDGDELAPLPGELVHMTLMEDSLMKVQKTELKKSMTNIINDYRQRFRQEYFTGYFLTDFDGDQMPELWIKSGNYRENSRLELYYPLPDGTLMQSSTSAEPGKYYVGDGYIIQVVGAGPGFISINKITINHGEMDVTNIRDIDLYASPDATIPEFKEKPAQEASLSNLGPLNEALR